MEVSNGISMNGIIIDGLNFTYCYDGANISTDSAGRFFFWEIH